MKTLTIPSDNLDIPARHIADYIKSQLAQSKSILWLVSGGSAIKVAVRARELVGIIDQGDDMQVVLADERYDRVNHPDSNYRQLIKAGFDATGLKLHPILAGDDIATTSRSYNDVLKRLLREVNVSIGLLGMGGDGHTAGLLPGNLLMDTQDYVDYFDGFDFQRITTTPAFLCKIDEVVLYAVGESKWPVIKQLETTDLPVAVLRLAKNLTVYSDYKGEEL